MLEKRKEKVLLAVLFLLFPRMIYLEKTVGKRQKVRCRERHWRMPYRMQELQKKRFVFYMEEIFWDS